MATTWTGSSASSQLETTVAASSRRLLLGRDALRWGLGRRFLRRRFLRGRVFELQVGRLSEGRVAGYVSASELEQRNDRLVEGRLGRQVDLSGTCGHERSHLSPISTFPVGASELLSTPLSE